MNGHCTSDVKKKKKEHRSTAEQSCDVKESKCMLPHSLLTDVRNEVEAAFLPKKKVEEQAWA